MLLALQNEILTKSGIVTNFDYLHDNSYLVMLFYKHESLFHNLRNIFFFLVKVRTIKVQTTLKINLVLLLYFVYQTSLEI